MHKIIFFLYFNLCQIGNITSSANILDAETGVHTYRHSKLQYILSFAELTSKTSFKWRAKIGMFTGASFEQICVLTWGI